jgi:hypothetical protein
MCGLLVGLHTQTGKQSTHPSIFHAVWFSLQEPVDVWIVSRFAQAGLHTQTG